MDNVRAKRHSVLETLRKDLAKGFISKEVLLGDYTFVLHTLNEDDEIYCDQYVRTISPLSLATSRKTPRLAASIRSINNIATGDLFGYPDDMPLEVRNEIDKDPIRKKYWTYDQMQVFLAEDCVRPFINRLYEEYEELEKKRDEAIGELPFLSRKTLSTESNPMSLHANTSLPPTRT